MEEFWNQTCVLIDTMGNVILSDPNLHGHNSAISYCAKKIGLEINEMQSMVTMLEIIVSAGHIALLNTGKSEDDNHGMKRNGYLALPASFQETQIPKLELLSFLLEEEYHAITSYQLENHCLKKKCMGNVQSTVQLINDILSNLASSHDIQKK